MGFIRTTRNLFQKEWWQKKRKKHRLNKEFKRIRKLPRFTDGYAYIFDKPFKFHDNLSFIDTYKELFEEQIYRFKPSGNSPVILDCGANMGLSVLFFARNYPDHIIIAFEPERHIFAVLQENVQTFGLKNVTLVKKAVWIKEEQLKFYSDKGMGGRVNLDYQEQQPAIIDAVPLASYLSGQIDFLKIDIEGAEDPVLRSCIGKLRNANHLFFEYHNHVQSPQTLDELLKLIREEGFLYYVKESAVRKRPFVDEQLICEQFDMALNVFCYKP